MYEKTISYTDYDGNQRTETSYFHLSKAELIEMNFSENGGLEKILQKMIAEQDQVKIFKMFKDIILMSYGEKSNDGKRFIKNQEMRDAFVQSEAYSELLMELISDEDKAADFLQKIIPSDLNNGSIPVMDKK